MTSSIDIINDYETLFPNVKMVRTNGKKPVEKDWNNGTIPKGASCRSINELKSLVKTDKCNMAFITGAVNGIIVIDIDIGDGIKDFKKIIKMGEGTAISIESYIEKNNICAIKTPSGGFHCYYNNPKGIEFKSHFGFVKGCEKIDIQGDNKCVITAGSVYKGCKDELVKDADGNMIKNLQKHKCGRLEGECCYFEGNIYEWINKTKPTDMPDYMIQKFKKKSVDFYDDETDNVDDVILSSDIIDEIIDVIGDVADSSYNVWSFTLKNLQAVGATEEQCLTFSSLSVKDNPKLTKKIYNDSKKIKLKNALKYIRGLVLKEGQNLELAGKICKEGSHYIRIDDAYACKVLFNKIGSDKIMKNKGEIFYYDESTGLWEVENKNKLFKRNVRKYASSLLFKIEDKKREGKVITYNYSGDANLCNKMSQFIEPLIIEKSDKDLQVMVDNTLFKTLFKNGVYHWKTKKLIKEFNPNEFWYYRVERNYNPVRNEDVIKKVNHSIFEIPFTKDKVLLKSGEYLKQVLVNSIAGNYTDKRIVFLVGDADTGKGVLTTFLENAFNGFVGQFNSNVLIYKDNQSDNAKGLSWIKKFEGKRIGLSNEGELGKKLSSNMIKTFSSGGDKIEYRTNHKDEREFYQRNHFYVLSNDVPELDNKDDDGLKSRIRLINYETKFVNIDNCPISMLVKSSDGTMVLNPDMNISLADDKIKKDCIYTNEWCDSLVQIFIDSFNKIYDCKTDKIFIKDVDDVLLQSKEYLEDDGVNFEAMFNELYVITDKKTDYIGSKEIIADMKTSRNLSLSHTRIYKELVKKGAIKKQMSSQKLFLNMRRKTSEEKNGEIVECEENEENEESEE